MRRRMIKKNWRRIFFLSAVCCAAQQSTAMWCGKRPPVVPQQHGQAVRYEDGYTWSHQQMPVSPFSGFAHRPGPPVAWVERPVPVYIYQGDEEVSVGYVSAYVSTMGQVVIKKILVGCPPFFKKIKWRGTSQGYLLVLAQEATRQGAETKNVQILALPRPGGDYMVLMPLPHEIEMTHQHALAKERSPVAQEEEQAGAIARDEETAVRPLVEEVFGPDPTSPLSPSVAVASDIPASPVHDASRLFRFLSPWGLGMQVQDEQRSRVVAPPPLGAGLDHPGVSTEVASDTDEFDCLRTMLDEDPSPLSRRSDASSPRKSPEYPLALLCCPSCWRSTEPGITGGCSCDGWQEFL